MAESIAKDSDLTFFTNEEGQKLEDRFRKTLKDVQYFDVLVGYFRSSGFYRLYKDLENIDKIRILVGLNVDKKTVDVINTVRQETLDFESHTRTKEILTEEIVDEIYHAEDKFEVEQGIHKFIEFIRSGKLEIRAYPSQNIHAKVYISRFKPEDRDYGRVITGSSNFSESGLNSQYEFNVELKNRQDVKYALEKFEALWLESVELNETYIDTIKTKTWLNDTITPYELYLKFLYEYFKERIEIKSQTDRTPLPDGFMDLRYQREAVAQLAETVNIYNGAFLSDVVGLGKTYIASMYMRLIAGKKLIICPPHLIDNWKEAIRDFEVGGAVVTSHGKLEDIANGNVDYSYIFVDEAHRFRNKDTESYQFLQRLCYGRKVILITATPLNNSIFDFEALLKLFLDTRKSPLPRMSNIDDFFTKARRDLKKYEKYSPEYLEELRNKSEELRNKVLKPLMIRRTRTEIKGWFVDDITKQGLSFPDIDDPHRIVYEFDRKTDLIFDQTIAKIKEFNFARYRNNLLPDVESESMQITSTQERNLIGFLKTMLVKRLESSRYAFLKTVGRFIKSYRHFITMYHGGTIYINFNTKLLENIADDDEEKIFETLENDKNAIGYPVSAFQPDLLDKLEEDLEILEWIYDAWSSIPTDFKKDEFVRILKTDSRLQENKLIIFSESTETGIDLYNTLYETYGSRVLLYSSNYCKYNNDTISAPVAKELIIYNYNPKSQMASDDIRILITTDVLAEGIDLHRSNVLINYDLPWNPTRVLQRVGRVNRVGSVFDKIHIYNIFPTSTSDGELNLENNIKAKIQAFHDTLGEDAKYLTEEEDVSSKSFGNDLYNNLLSKNMYEEDENAFSELKYIRLIEDIRENNLDLFNKIKYLPKKSRSCRNYKDLDKKNLITFFKKGPQKLLIITDCDIHSELQIDEAIPYFECEPDCEKLPMESIFYELLQYNKDRFEELTQAEEIEKEITKQGTSHKEVINRIKYAIKEGKLLDTQEEFLKKVIERIESGVILNKISGKIKKELAKTADSLEVFNIIKKEVPEEFLKRDRETVVLDNGSQREVILSELLVNY